MKARVILLLLVLGLAGAGVLAFGRNFRKGASIDEEAVRKILADRTRPWFQGHQVPAPRVMQTPYAAPEAMGAFPDPPVRTPVMPPEVAYHLTMGRRTVPEGHPFQGRPAALVDMRIRSRHMLEHIPDSLHAVWKDLPGALKDGALKDVSRKTLVIIYGDIYPHFEAPHHFRAAGFDAVYCLEGGLQVWKSRGYPVESSGSLAEFARQVEIEKGGSATPALGPLEPENIGPAALRTVMESGLNPLIVFVGDEATFNAGHIPGAIRVSEKEVTERFKNGDKDQLIAVYCGCCEGIAKGLSGIAVEQLRTLGFKRLLHLEGHLKGWKDLGYPLEAGEGEKSGRK